MQCTMESFSWGQQDGTKDNIDKRKELIKFS